MELTGSYIIPALRETVWMALNDPEILRQCITGCKELSRTSETEFKASIFAKIGPVKTTFQGAVTLSEIDPTNGYRITGALQGGAAGFAQGGAKVVLKDVAEGTLLEYTASADVGGKLASVGSRLVQGVVKKMADDFFGKFAAKLAGEDAEKPAEVEDLDAKKRPPVPVLAWVIGGAVCIAGILYLLW